MEPFPSYGPVFVPESTSVGTFCQERLVVPIGYSVSVSPTSPGRRGCEDCCERKRILELLPRSLRVHRPFPDPTWHVGDGHVKKNLIWKMKLYYLLRVR